MCIYIYMHAYTRIIFNYNHMHIDICTTISNEYTQMVHVQHYHTADTSSDTHTQMRTMSLH